LDVKNGSLDLTTLDFTRSRETFTQQGVKDGQVDLAGLRGALAANATTTIDVHNIREPEQYGVYFREEMAQKFSTEKERTRPVEDRPLLVLVIVSGILQFGFGKPVAIAPPPGGNFVVYYVRCESQPTLNSKQGILDLPQVSRQDGLERFEQTVDGIGDALKDLKPRAFTVHSAGGVRKAIAAIVNELSRK
jgi:hypothetical protein